jgi:hypothetical protein
LKSLKALTCREVDDAADASNYDHVGRIYRHNGGPQDGKWFWSLTAFGPEISRNIGNCTGTEDTPRAATRMVEDAWFAAIKGSSLTARLRSAMPMRWRKQGNNY